MQQVSAPAKVILLGEHAVVYNQPAIAVPLSDLRATARIIGPNPHGISIIAEDTDQVFEIASEQTSDDPIALTLRIILDALEASIPDIKISIKSDIPVASGLGSGAAISAVLGRILSIAVNRPLENDHLNEIVYQTEKIHHGTPSGIDNTVVVYEQPVYFVRDRPIEHIAIKRPIHLLVADTGKRALTRIAVAGVHQLYESNPEATQQLLDAIGQLVIQARQAIEHGDTIELGQLMTHNHSLLQRLTVSSEELDTLVKAALANGALGAKLSGGGRGGNMIALVNTETVKAVEAALYTAGAHQVYSTTVHA